MGSIPIVITVDLSAKWDPEEQWIKENCFDVLLEGPCWVEDVFSEALEVIKILEDHATIPDPVSYANRSSGWPAANAWLLDALVLSPSALNACSSNQ